MSINEIDIFHKNNICHPVLHSVGNHNIWFEDQYDNQFFNKLLNFGSVDFFSIDRKKISKSVNINLTKYKDFDDYINNISKNIKRDYYRVLYGEKNRAYNDICLNTVINYYKNYICEFDISSSNNANKIINDISKKYKKKNASLSYPYYCLLDNLLTQYPINDNYIQLSRYIRVKLTFNLLDIYKYVDDIEEIILQNQKIKITGNWKRYHDWIRGIRYRKQKNMCNVNLKNNIDNKHKIIWYGVYDFDKLVSFIGINYDGELSCVGYFFSNHNYYKYSCTTFLLINVIKILLQSNIKILNYFANNSPSQLEMYPWKKKFGFEETYLLIKKP